MSTLISLFAITQCSGSTPETIYASLARAGAFVHFFSVLWWQTLVMLGLVSVAAWLRSGWLGGAVATGVVFVVFQLLQHVVFMWGIDAFPQIALPWTPTGAPLLDKPRDRRRAEHRARTMVANAEPWLGDIARRVATEEPKAEDTDDEGDAAWEDSKKSNDDGALDHIVASALKGAVPSRRSAVRDLLLSNGVTSDVLIHASGSAAGAQLVLHALDELAERHTPNGLCFSCVLFYAVVASMARRFYAVAAAAAYPWTSTQARRRTPRFSDRGLAHREALRRRRDDGRGARPAAGDAPAASGERDESDESARGSRGITQLHTRGASSSPRAPRPTRPPLSWMLPFERPGTCL